MKKPLFILLIFILLISLLSTLTSARGEFAGGRGTEEDPYLIETVEQLNNVRNYLDKHFKQIANIDLSVYSEGEGWIPVGDKDNPFTGSFDGGNYKILNLTINREYSDVAGFFGFIDTEFMIKNVILKNVDIKGGMGMGSLAAVLLNGEIARSSVSGTLVGARSVGGLIGANVSGIIFNCNSKVEINYDEFKDAKGPVIAIGGLVGENGGEIIYCNAGGYVEGKDCIGGLVGIDTGIVENCYATGDVIGWGSSIGGVIGQKNEGTVRYSYAAGDVETSKEGGEVGGFVGRNAGNIINCYATGDVKGPVGESTAGAFVGENRLQEKGKIKSCYAVGKVAGNDRSDVGGFSGLYEGEIINCYHNKETSGRHEREESSALTTSELKKQSTFHNWNFTSVWTITEGETYPYLQWQDEDVPLSLAEAKEKNEKILAESKRKDNTVSAEGKKFAGGKGTGEDPFLVETAAQLNNVRNHLDKHFRQIADIDLSNYSQGRGWEPIGRNSHDREFTGTYNGNGYRITNLKIDRPLTDYIGLFGSCEESLINNVVLEEVNIRGDDYVGALTGGNAWGEIKNCQVRGEITGNGSYTGGLVGGNIGRTEIVDNSGESSYEYRSHIINCSTRVEVKGNINTGGLTGTNSGKIIENRIEAEVKGNENIGGLVGENIAIIEENYVKASIDGQKMVGGVVGRNKSDLINNYSIITVKGGEYVGGCAGYSDNTGYIKDNYGRGKVTGTSDVGGLIGYNKGHAQKRGEVIGNYSAVNVLGNISVGGLIGMNNGGDVRNSCAVGDIIGEEKWIGGLIGRNNMGDIKASFSTGKVEGIKTTGGLVGYNWKGRMINSYATGEIKGDTYVGGLAGYNSAVANISKCYAAGKVTGKEHAGGLAGVKRSGAGEIKNSYYDKNLTGQSDEEKGIPETTTRMKQQSIYKDWNFADIWTIDEGNSYPYLQWQENIPDYEKIIKDEFAGKTEPGKVKFAGGSGTGADPYLIETAEQLNNVRGYPDKYFKQIADIDLSGFSEGEGWGPIGSEDNGFRGTFNGNGYKITNLYINNKDVKFSGLFGFLNNIAEIKDVVLEEVKIQGGQCAGALAAYNNQGTVLDSYTEGEVIGQQIAGGLVGYNKEGKIKRSHTSQTVSGKQYVGGLIGTNDNGELTDCSAGGNIEGGKYVGGLVGFSKGKTIRSYAKGKIKGDTYVGGIVGGETGAIIESYFIGDVTGVNGVGGVVGGTNEATITESYFLGNVTGDNSIGGFVGVNNGDITESFTAGRVSGDKNVGGFVGDYKGGTISDVYYDISDIEGDQDDPGILKNTSEMMQKSTFKNWDFANTWKIDQNESYPYFKWQDKGPEY